MTLRQLVYLRELTKQGFNVSAVAEALYTSQPSVSRQLQDLVDELEVELFVHSGNRLIGLTEAGRLIADISADVLFNIKKIKNVAADSRRETHGMIVIATTRHMAVNRLPAIMSRFCRQQPAVDVMVHEEEPKNIITLLIGGEIDIGILSDQQDRHPYLVYFPLDEWRLTVVVSRDHELFQKQSLKLEDLTKFPISTYMPGSISRRVMEEAFRDHYLNPHLAYSFGSSLLILKYVESGVGVGVVAESAFDPTVYPTLRSIDASHLFPPLKTWITLPRRAYLRDFVYTFLALLLPELDRRMINEEKDKPIGADEKAG